MKVEIDNNYGNIIHKNGGGNTHVVKITSYSREEDEDKTLVTTIHPTTKKVEASIEEKCSNPSKRRHGIVLDIEDEATREISQLAIYQHKGCTYIEWL